MRLYHVFPFFASCVLLACCGVVDDGGTVAQPVAPTTQPPPRTAPVDLNRSSESARRVGDRNRRLQVEVSNAARENRSLGAALRQAREVGSATELELAVMEGLAGDLEKTLAEMGLLISDQEEEIVALEDALDHAAQASAASEQEKAALRADLEEQNLVAVALTANSQAIAKERNLSVGKLEAKKQELADCRKAKVKLLIVCIVLLILLTVSWAGYIYLGYQRARLRMLSGGIIR